MCEEGIDISNVKLLYIEVIDESPLKRKSSYDKSPVMRLRFELKETTSTMNFLN